MKRKTTTEVNKKTHNKKRKLIVTSNESSSESEDEQYISKNNEKTQSESDSEDYNDEDDEQDEDYYQENTIEKQLKKLKSSNKKLYNKLTKVQQEIEKSEPKVEDLFNSELLLQDQALLCQYYEIYKTQIPNTHEWLETRNTYNKLLSEFKANYKQYTQYTKKQQHKMEIEAKKFSSYNTKLELKYKILNLETSDYNKEIIYRRYEELVRMKSYDDEYGKLKKWLEWAISIPHDKIKKIKNKNISKFIKDASKKLDKELYGMQKIKEQILLFLSAKLMFPDMKHTNLGLVGQPGTGKTSIARLIAKIMDWGFEQISFGGIERADFLKGHEYTYVGAQPGEMVKCLKKIQHKNGVIFMDELDKIEQNNDIKSALLHITDQTQNTEFRDNFLSEITIDLSHIWFISSMNKIPQDKALADRWWIINIDGYTQEDKIHIVKNYIVPKILKNLKIDINSIIFEDTEISFLINKVCNSQDKGIRTIEKFIKDIINKIYFIITHQDKKGLLPFKVSFDPKFKINLPLIVTKEIINILVNNNKNTIEDIFTSMYI